MLNQKLFGEKLRNHRKSLGMTQEEAAAKIGVSGQAVSKWETGDCLPDCFNLKEICDLYGLSADALLETECDGNIEAAASKIEQIGTEFIWAKSAQPMEDNYLHKELGEDLLAMWKGLYFAETGNRKIQAESKARGNTRICGPFGLKIWDDDGVVCVVKSELVKTLSPFSSVTVEVLTALCTEEGQKLICSLECASPISKEQIIEKTGIELYRLNELLLMFTENNVIEYLTDYERSGKGYKLSGHCGIAAYMVLAAMHILNKKRYEVSEYIINKTE